MTLCLQSQCLKVNPDGSKFCQYCGKPLSLKDRYQAVELLGQGGFGKTFIALDCDKPSKPKCVIKQCSPQLERSDSSGLAKAEALFAEEAKHLEQLGHHAQIPELYAYFIVEEQQYFVQEYVRGQTLAQELVAEGVFSQSKIEALLRDLLPVLAFIHRIPVIHRDIKPDNIIRRASNNNLVLVDFGAAKRVTPKNRSITGTVIGTAEYVAQEQMAGKPKEASDIYSLGVTCLHLLTGVSPFNLFDTEEFEWVWRDFLVNNPVDQRLGTVLDKMVCPGTKKRYQSAEEVCLALGMSIETQFPVPLPSLHQATSSSTSAPLPQTTIIQSAQPKFIPPGKALGTYREVIPARGLLGSRNASTEIEMVKLSAGRFLMGSFDSDQDAYEEEKPQHCVTVKAFAIGKYPVTQSQYKAVMGKNSSDFSGNPNNPVECVKWDEARTFLNKLSQQTGKHYRLPSEAEWEYACRAGTTTKYYFGDNAEQLEDYAWFNENSGRRTHPVGQKKPNGWGLYDMYGNIWEWCKDKWHKNYNKAPKNKLPWVQSYNDNKVRRGGSWGSSSGYCRSASRNYFNSDAKRNFIGLRVVCSSSVP